jgi:SAM-dependent methyltransferase
MNKIDYSAHNWLPLKINNQFLERNVHHIRGRVIDLGCGTCQYKSDMLKGADEYIGVDWKGSMHDQSQVDIFANMTEPLPFEDNYGDTVTCFQVMEHLPEPAFFLKEIHRILKPNGCLLLSTPFMWHIHEAPYDFFRYTRYGLEYLLGKAGFAQPTIEEMTGFWQMWILKLNYHSSRLARGPLRYFCIPFWWLGQVLAPTFDRFNKNSTQCAGYFVLAWKE